MHSVNSLLIHTPNIHSHTVTYQIAHSLTQSQISWFINGEQVYRSVQATLLPNGSLYLHPPLLPGQLELSCQASSHLGTALSPTIIVTVS